MAEIPNSLTYSEGTKHPQARKHKKSTNWWLAIPVIIIIAGGGWFAWRYWYTQQDTFEYSYDLSSIPVVRGNLDSLLPNDEMIDVVFPEFSLDITTALESDEARVIFGDSESAQTITAFGGYSNIFRKKSSTISAIVVELPSQQATESAYTVIHDTIQSGQVPFGIPLDPKEVGNIGDTASLVIARPDLQDGSATITDVYFMIAYRAVNTIQIVQGSLRDDIPDPVYADDGSTTESFNKYIGTLEEDIIQLAQRTVVSYADYQPVDVSDTDSDNDGLTDDEEIRIGTNPGDPDTDDDGFTDRIEVDNGFDPLVP